MSEAQSTAAPTGHAHPSYVKIWGVLVVLLIVSVLGPMLEIRIVTLLTAFGIAIVKAYMVAKNFMHVNIEPRYVAYLLLTMLVMMLVFFAGTSPDVMRHEGQNWSNVAAREFIARAQGGGVEEPEGPFIASEKFAQVCAVCHGTEGHGDGTASAALDPKPANFSDPAFWATRDVDHVVRVITGGGASVGRSALMPAFGSQFDEEQVRQLAEHVRSLGPATEPPAAGDGSAEATP